MGDGYCNAVAPVRCSLCGMEFDDADPLIHVRKERHRSWHDPAATTYRRNMIPGVVKWIPLGDGV